MTSVVEVAKRQIERQGQMIEYALTARERAIERGDQEHAADMADAAARCSEIAEYWARYIPTGAQAQGGGEPVGEIVPTYEPICSVVSMYASDLPVGTKLYAAPPSAPVGVEGLQRYSMARGSDGERWSVYMDPDPAGEWVKWADAQMAALTAALAQQPAAVFRNDGNSEDDFIADDAIACTACGGSGHRDDQQPAAVAPVGVERLVSNAIAQGKRLQWSAVMGTLERLRGTLALAAQQPPAEAQS